MYTVCLQGFGSKVLKKSGWREGSGVGASSQGISEPLEAEGQHPRSKKGLGYVPLLFCVPDIIEACL